MIKMKKQFDLKLDQTNVNVCDTREGLRYIKLFIICHRVYAVEIEIIFLMYRLEN